MSSKVGGSAFARTFPEHSHQLVGLRLSRDDGVVDGEPVGLEDPAVGRNDVTGLHEDDVAHDELFGGNLLFDALAKYMTRRISSFFIPDWAS